MIEDAELLRRYAENRSEDAFAELVRRHLNLVYSAALRQTGGDAHRAQDVAQLVFTDLARKAAALARRPTLAGWLYTSTHYATTKALRTEWRRQAREQEAHAMQEILSDSGPTPDWDRLRPVLDAAMRDLNERDREAVLLRFFEGRGFAEVGARLSLTENAARMRVERALEKLRAQLARRGVTSTAAALAVLLAEQAVVAAPAGVAAHVTGAALLGATAAGGGAISLLHILSMTKVQVGVASLALVAAGTGVALQQQANARLQAEIDSLQLQSREVTRLKEENRRLARTAAEVAELRQDDAELAKLSVEAETLKQRLHAQLEARAYAARTSSYTGPIYDVRQLDRLPAPRYQARPIYPLSYREAGITGEVTVSFVVDAQGRVRDVQAVKGSSTHAEFGEAAVAAVQKWRFTPGEKAGVAVGARMQVPIVFSIAPDAKAGERTIRPLESWF
ncbi:MAG: TonB family protein [Opitutae bacterium]|nr:TonB family protein [Opitutae bacterium]